MIHWIIWGFIGALYSPVFIQLYKMRWKTIDYTHAYFILPVALLWLIVKRKELATVIPAKAGIQSRAIASNLVSLSIFVLGLLMFIFGWKWDYLMITTLSLIPILYGMILFLYGGKMAKALSFPILYMLLLVPPPLGVLDAITLPMRHGISIATEWLFNLIHIPITREGLMLSVGGHEVFMGAPCSGFRSLITMISLGLAYVFFTKMSTRNRLILIASVVPFALLGNLIRVTGMCLVTYFIGEDAGHKFHDTSGLVIFIILILCLIGLESFLEKHKE